MNRIRLFYFYEAGAILRAINAIRHDTKLDDSIYSLYRAETVVAGLLNQQLVPLRSSKPFAEELLASIKRLTRGQERDRILSFMEAYTLTNALAQFNTAFNGEMGIADTYVVSPKRGYDTPTLIQAGEVLFPAELSIKVPESLADLREAGKCIAFELPTAAAFHLHRANESVLHRYFDCVTNGEPRPVNRNMGDYLAVLERKNAAEKKVRSALRDLKDLHRNPLVHPEHSLDSIDQALAILGSVHAVMVYLLEAIPDPRLSNGAVGALSLIPVGGIVG
jgi:hypothetical protein